MIRSNSIILDEFDTYPIPLSPQSKDRVIKSPNTNIHNIQLTKAQKEKALTLVEKVFADFTESMNEMLIFAEKHAYDKPFIKIGSTKQLKNSINSTEKEENLNSNVYSLTP